jgi:hypothetical protein
MGDLVMIATVLGFFGACIGYVALCDRVIGPDAVGGDGTADRNDRNDRDRDDRDAHRGAAAIS